MCRGGNARRGYNFRLILLTPSRAAREEEAEDDEREGPDTAVEDTPGEA